MPEQASLFRSGVPLNSPLEGHLLWDLASNHAWLSQELSILFYFTELHDLCYHEVPKECAIYGLPTMMSV